MLTQDLVKTLTSKLKTSLKRNESKHAKQTNDKKYEVEHCLEAIFSLQPETLNLNDDLEMGNEYDLTLKYEHVSDSEEDNETNSVGSPSAKMTSAQSILHHLSTVNLIKALLSEAHGTGYYINEIYQKTKVTKI